jgi:primosomal protein N' (replication factor Y) (superfamily II helicase)
MSLYCEVALPVPLDRTFTYAVSAGQDALRGARVIVPFRAEKLIGIVTSSTDTPPTDFEAKTVEAVLDDEPLLGEHLMRLAEWIAQYYVAPLGEVLRGMLPLAAEVRRTVCYRITDSGRDALAATMDGAVPLPALGGTSREGASHRRGANLAGDKQSLEKRVLARLAEGKPVTASALRASTSASLSVMAAMVRKKLIARETALFERDARRIARFAVLIQDARLPALTEKQQAILAELAACGGESPLAALRAKNLPRSTLETLVRRG